jgi:hypothetical protein
VEIEVEDVQWHGAGAGWKEYVGPSQACSYGTALRHCVDVVSTRLRSRISTMRQVIQQLAWSFGGASYYPTMKIDRDCGQSIKRVIGQSVDKDEGSHEAGCLLTRWLGKDLRILSDSRGATLLCSRPLTKHLSSHCELATIIGHDFINGIDMVYFASPTGTHTKSRCGR